MSIESWKSFFEMGGVILLFLTFACGAGVLLTANKVNQRQAQRLRAFESDLLSAKVNLAIQQERAAKAEGAITLAEQHAAEANQKAEAFKFEIAKANAAAKQAEARALRLQYDVGKRTFELVDRQFLLDSLRSFTPQDVDFIVYGIGTDQQDLVWQIIPIFKELGWPTHFQTPQSGDAVLVQVWAFGGEAQAVGSFVVLALARSGIKARLVKAEVEQKSQVGRQFDPRDDLGKANLRILVGTK